MISQLTKRKAENFQEANIPNASLLVFFCTCLELQNLPTSAFSNNKSLNAGTMWYLRTDLLPWGRISESHNIKEQQFEPLCYDPKIEDRHNILRPMGRQEHSRGQGPAAITVKMLCLFSPWLLGKTLKLVATTFITSEIHISFSAITLTVTLASKVKFHTNWGFSWIGKLADVEFHLIPISSFCDLAQFSWQ